MILPRAQRPVRCEVPSEMMGFYMQKKTELMLLDMVHDNPGEEPFETSFRDPNKLISYGYDVQVFKHINCIIRFDKLGLDLFPKESE